MLFQVVPSVLLSMVALITTYMKESDWLLKNFHQSENGLKSYHGEQNQGYHVKEHKKLCQKQVSKVTLHFVWGQLSRKQTVLCVAVLHPPADLMEFFKQPKIRSRLIKKKAKKLTNEEKTSQWK